MLALSGANANGLTGKFAILLLELVVGAAEFLDGDGGASLEEAEVVLETEETGQDWVPRAVELTAEAGERHIDMQ